MGHLACFRIFHLPYCGADLLPCLSRIGLILLRCLERIIKIYGIAKVSGITGTEVNRRQTG